MEKFNNSIGYDQMMWKEDITGSVAYADALGRCSILEQKEVDSIKEGLKKVREEWASGIFECTGRMRQILCVLCCALYARC